MPLIGRRVARDEVHVAAAFYIPNIDTLGFLDYASDWSIIVANILLVQINIMLIGGHN
jgi:hypothetical protein